MVTPTRPETDVGMLPLVTVAGGISPSAVTTSQLAPLDRQGQKALLLERKKAPEHMPCKCPRCKRWTLQQCLNRRYFNCLYCGATFHLEQVKYLKEVRIVP